MTFSNINVSNPNDGLGDKLRDAFVIVNENFIEVENFLVSQVTDSYLSATLSNYVTLISFNNQNNSIGATISTLQSDINNYRDNDEAVGVVMLNHLCGLDVKYLKSLPIDVYNTIFSVLSHSKESLAA
jgi:hypothetical protein